MSRVRVFIEDHTGNKRREARLAANTDIEQLIPAIVTSLKLPISDPNGTPITYHLAFDNRQLQRNETLSSAGVTEGSIVTLVPEMDSGGPNLSTSPYMVPEMTAAPRYSTRLASILHLSDLHLQTDDDAYNWVHQLNEDLDELNCNHLDFIVISGDITNSSTPEEYNAARLFITKLYDLSVGPQRIVIVPGNHDLNWKLAKKSYKLFWGEDWHQEINIHEYEDLKSGLYIDYKEVVALRHKELYKQRFTYFSNFYKSAIGKPYPLDYEQQYQIYTCHEKKLLILGLNSAWELDHHYRNRASINRGAVSNAIQEINNLGGYSDYLKIAVWHHPLNSSNEDKIQDNGFMGRLAKAGFRLALHGHIHKAESSLYCYDHAANGRRINIVAAGTFGAPVKEWVPGHPLQYNLLKIEGDKLNVETRRREELNGPWKPDARWSQGAGKDPLPRYTIDLS